MKIKLDDVSFTKQANEAVLARYQDRVISVSLYHSYRLNREEALRQLNLALAFNPDMKTLTKDNFKDAMEAYAYNQSHCSQEYRVPPAVLAKEFLEGFYEYYFEIDTTKEARRAEYLKLKEEFEGE